MQDIAKQSIDQWLTAGGVALNGTVYGPPTSAIAWKNPGCPLVPRAFRESDGVFANTIDQLKPLIKQDDLTVGDLDAQFLARHGISELPRDVVYALRGDSQHIHFSPSDTVIPAGVPLEWVNELPIPSRARRSISNLIATRTEQGTQMSPVSVHQFMNSYGVGLGTLHETLCVIESAEVESLPTDMGQQNGMQFHKINEIMSASYDASHNVDGSYFRAYSALEEFASWATAENLGDTFGDVIRRIHHESIVSDEWSALAELPFDGLAGVGKHPYVAINEWIGGLSNRDTLIFMYHLNSNPYRKTLEELGQMLGLSRERVRQIESKLKADLRTLAEHSRPIQWRLDTIRREIGIAAPLQRVEHLLAAPDGCPDFRSILLDFAGPFKIQDNWAVLLSHVASDPTNSLIDSADRYGVIDISICTKRLNNWGLDPSLHKEWLTRNDSIYEFNGKLFRKPHSAQDRAAIALIDIGQPADVDTIIEHIGWDGHRGTIANGLSNDSRFIRVNQREWGLIDWNMRPYESIAESIRSLLRNSGQPMHTSEVADLLQAQLGVPRTSIQSYFSTPAFVTEDHYIRLRRINEPYEYPAGLIRRNRGVFKLAEQRVALLIQVDHEILRGSGRPLPRAAAEILQLRIGETLAFSQPNDPAVSTYFNEMSHSGPSLGSLQALVRTLNGELGDYLVLVLDRNAMSLETSLVKAEEVEQSWDTVAKLTGITPDGKYRALAATLECDEAEVIEILQSRGDEAVLKILPPS